MPYSRRSQVNKQLALLSNRPRVAGIKRGTKWKYKVFTRRFSPEFTKWKDALEYANAAARLTNSRR